MPARSDEIEFTAIGILISAFCGAVTVTKTPWLAFVYVPLAEVSSFKARTM